MTQRLLFELLELPDGRCYVARPASSAEMTLVAGSFAKLDTGLDHDAPEAEGHPDPVGVYASRDEAELAIQRADPAPQDPLAPFATWLRQD